MAKGVRMGRAPAPFGVCGPCGPTARGAFGMEGSKDTLSETSHKQIMHDKL